MQNEADAWIEEDTSDEVDVYAWAAALVVEAKLAAARRKADTRYAPDRTED
jgi:hypothetical protein